MECGPPKADAAALAFWSAAALPPLWLYAERHGSPGAEEQGQRNVLPAKTAPP